MLKSAFSQIVLLIVFILLSGCGGTPDVQVNELSRNTVSYDETIHINNCGGKADSEQTASHSFATTIEGGAGLSAGYKLIVEGNVSAKYGQYSNVSKSQKLTAPPETNMEFVLRWSDEVHAGNVTINGSDGNFEVRIPIEVEQLSSKDLGGCGSSQALSGIQNAIPTPLAANLPLPIQTFSYGVLGQGQQQTTLTSPGVCALYFYPFGGKEKTFVFKSENQVWVQNYNGTLSCWQTIPSLADVGINHPFSTYDEVLQANVVFSSQITYIDPHALK